MFDVNAVIDGAWNIVLGIGKIKGGMAIISFTGAATLATGGAVTPIAVAGALAGGGAVLNGWAQVSLGLAQVIAGVVTDEPIDTDTPKTFSDVIRMPIQEASKKMTGKKSETVDTVFDGINEFPPSKATVFETLIDQKTPLHAPGHPVGSKTPPIEVPEQQPNKANLNE